MSKLNLVRRTNINEHTDQRFNLSNLLYHTLRTEFPLRKGTTAREMSAYLTSQGVEHTEHQVTIALRDMAGLSHNKKRNALVTKRLKKDQYKAQGRQCSPLRFYINQEGSFRTKGMYGTVKGHNVRPATVKKVCSLTGRNPKTKTFTR